MPIFNKLAHHDPNAQKVQKNAIYYNKTQHSNFQGNPLYQATKWHLDDSYSHLAPDRLSPPALLPYRATPDHPVAAG